MTILSKKAARIWHRQMLSEPIIVHLFTNESWNSQADPGRLRLRSYVDPIGAGYRPLTISPTAWTHHDQTATVTASFRFAGPAPLKMRGYYVTTEDGRTLLLADAFPAAYDIALEDDGIDVLLTSRLVVEPTSARPIPVTS